MNGDEVILERKIESILNHKLTFENVGEVFRGSDSGKVLEVDDHVRARVIAVSVASGRSGKLGLTMRQPFLGKIEWIENEIAEINELALKGGDTEKAKKKTSSKKSSKKTTKAT